MKSLNNYFLSLKEFLDFFAHVPCSFFGEGEGEDLGGGDVFLFHHVRDLCGYGRGLACACEDQLGACVCLMASSWRGFRVERREFNILR
ncbi:MAG: hypothetical protein L6282_13525 [Candidatus Methanoperedenaceae archaeon]|nr:hypothetical protein [Candidatus Methanoperedenaceae archaeon]